MKIEGSPDQDGTELILVGIGVSPGVVIGPAFVIAQHGVPVPEHPILHAHVDREIRRFQAALGKAQKQLAQLRHKAASLNTGSADDVVLLLDAYKGMLANGSRLVRGIEDRIATDHINAEAAIERQVTAIATDFEAMNDAYLAARAGDVREAGTRLIRLLQMQNYNPFADVPEGSIIVAEDITPADAALMNPAHVAGFAAVLGGAEGHAAIMARAQEMPAVLGVAALVGGIKSGDTLVLDGIRGEVIVRPSAATLARARQESQRLAREARRLRSLGQMPAVTTDGTTIVLQANLEWPREAEQALEVGATGVGLLRTEFMFMNRPTLPNENEQYEMLADMVERMGGRPVTIRTLDVGGEKLAAAMGLSLGESVNPALGLRAIRLGLKEPQILDTQLSAILRAAAHGPVRILIPMVSSVAQMRQVRERLMQLERRLRRRGARIPSAIPPVGSMIEIPAAALAADALARVCDFFAIGSNDLTQYTLAIDRGDDRVADLYDPYHPGVLRLIQFAIAAAWRANIPASLCGEMAGDPKASALLMGLGLRDFSMAPSRLAAVKNEIRSTSMAQATALAENVMAQNDEDTIRHILAEGPGVFPLHGDWSKR